jgi:hypothetical protein
LVDEWRQRLEPCKQIILKQLFKHEDFVSRLEYLVTFPGLADGLEIGNIHKHLALHCDKELLHYLDHIIATWNHILSNNLDLRSAVDIKTVKALEMLAPATSVTDRANISNGVDSGRLFARIHDRAIRENIKTNLLGLRVMIPTMSSFHQNANYFSIGSNIIRNHVLDPKADKKTELSVALKGIWSSRQPRVEVRDCEFRECDVRPENQFNIAYVQAFLAALRHFSKLSNHKPRKEPGQPIQQSGTDTGFTLQFGTSVSHLGFHTPKLQSTLSRNTSPLPQNAMEYCEDEFDIAQESLRRRWNRPFGKAYIELRRRLFLPEILAAHIENNTGPSILFIHNDFINAFFDVSFLFGGDYEIQLGPSPNNNPIAQSREDMTFNDVETTHTGHVEGNNERVDLTIIEAVPSLNIMERRLEIANTEVRSTNETEHDLPSLAVDDDCEMVDITQITANTTEDGIFGAPSSTGSSAPDTQSPRSALITMDDRYEEDSIYMSNRGQNSPFSPPSAISAIDRPNRSYQEPYQRLSSHSGPRLSLVVATKRQSRARSASPSTRPQSMISGWRQGNHKRRQSRIARSFISLDSVEYAGDSTTLSGGERSFLPPTTHANGTKTTSLGSSSSMLTSKQTSSSESRRRSFLMKGVHSEDKQSVRQSGDRSFLDRTPRTSSSIPLSGRSSTTISHRGRRTYQTVVATSDPSIDTRSNCRSFLREVRTSSSPAAEPFQPDIREGPIPRTTHSSVNADIYGRMLDNPVETRSYLDTAAWVDSTLNSDDIIDPERVTSCGTRSFLADTLSTETSPKDHRDRSFLPAELRGRTETRTEILQTPAVEMKFREFNGMMDLRKRTEDMGNYLRHRREWVAMIIQKGVGKTICHDKILAFVQHGGLKGGGELALVKAMHVERFRRQSIAKIRVNSQGKDR